LTRSASSIVGAVTMSPPGSSILMVANGTVRRSWHRPASTPPSEPISVNGGVLARTLVAQPSVVSTASRTASYRSTRSGSTWLWSKDTRRLAW
jgi:hypothetical protein